MTSILNIQKWSNFKIKQPCEHKFLQSLDESWLRVTSPFSLGFWASVQDVHTRYYLCAVADLEGGAIGAHPPKIGRLCFFYPILYQNA